MSSLYEQVFAIFENRDRRTPNRWVMSRAHIQAFHDVENERRDRERARIAEIPHWLPGFDATEFLAQLQPLPPPDFDKADEMRVMGLPIRIDDVDEMRLEPIGTDPMGRGLGSGPGA